MFRDRVVLAGTYRYRRAKARYYFPPNEDILRCPVHILSGKDTNLIRKTSLNKRLFRMPDGRHAVVFGYAPFCLSAGLKNKNENAEAIFLSQGFGTIHVVRIQAIKAIERGEKIICSSRIKKEIISNFSSVEDGNLAMREAQEKGYGVFAKRPFWPRARIAQYPVLVFPAKDFEFIRGTSLEKYHYAWYSGGAIALGLGSFFNTGRDGTTRTTNATYYFDYNARTTVYRCIKPILAGEEVTIPYNRRDQHIGELDFMPI